MDNEITTALIGVGAAIVGTVLGWVLNNLSNKGNLHIFVSYWKDSFKYNSLGVKVQCIKSEEVQGYTYKCSFDLYNSSGNVKIMRNIQIVFTDGKNDIEKQTPKDNASKRYSNSMVFYDEVEPINIPPKAVIKLNLHGGAWNKGDELDFIWKTKKIYLVYTNEKNKAKRILIKEEDYSNYFENHKCEESQNG